MIGIANPEVDMPDRYTLPCKDTEMVIRDRFARQISGDNSPKAKHNLIEMKCFWRNRKGLFLGTYSCHLDSGKRKLALLSY